MLLRLGRIEQSDLIKCRRLFSKLDRCLLCYQLCALPLAMQRQMSVDTFSSAHQCAVVTRARDNNLSLDVNDIKDLLEDKPNTAQLEDHNYDPQDHKVVEDSDLSSPRNRKSEKEVKVLVDTANPTFESDTS